MKTKTKIKYDLDKMLKKHKFYYLNSDITAKNFLQPETVETENPVIMKFDKSFTSEEALERCKKEGLRPANIYELLLAKENHPELLPDGKYTWVIALGQTWTDSDGLHRVPRLLRYSDGVWAFYLGCFEGPWGSDDFVLCFRDLSSDSLPLSESSDPLALPFELNIEGWIYKRNRKV